jgi:hypothetical protein
MASRKTHFKNVPTKEYYLERIKGDFNSNLNENEIDMMIKHDLEKLENIKTVSDIDEIIPRMYKLEASETTRVLRKFEGFGEEASNWDVIFSSGNNFDCIFHSFLTATSRNFRRLSQLDKNEFANFFRRGIFLNLPVVLCYKRIEPDLYKSLEKSLKEKDFLEDIVLFLLAAQFKFQVLAASSSVGYGNRFELISSGALKFVLPAECCEWRNNNNSISNWPIYCIYTSGAHFESIRVNGEYEISEKEAVSAMTSLEDGRHRPVTTTSIKKRTAKKKNVKRCKQCTFNNPGNSNACEICHTNLGGGTRRRRSHLNKTRHK